MFAASSAGLLHIEARWQNGDAADCKSVNAGSIPARASTTPMQLK